MAARSDFAQKLLTDLRSRKERMAASASHNTSNSKGMSRDSYANPAQHHRGSRQTKPLVSAGGRPANSQRTNNSARSLTIEETSNQLVPYKGAQSSEQIRDLSRALALAFQNKANFTKSNNNPILSFLHRIGIRKMDKRNNNNLKKLSNIHLNEISKGAQKLNQILSGVTFDGYSIEIGRELLKGAMDLEESLRMLANLQEGSDQVINPKRKSRIKLLDENGEEVDEERETSSPVPQNRLVERPRFSFDHSRGNKKEIKSDPIRSLMALSLTYTDETKTLPGNQPPNTTADVASHKRSASCTPDFRPEKGRLPNVIAKLMGLEEVPHGVNFETNVNKNSKTVQKINKRAENVSHSASERKIMQNNTFKVPSVDTKSISSPQFSEKFPRFVKNSSELHVKIKKQGTRKDEEDIGLERGLAKGVADRYHKDAEAKIVREGTSNSKEIRLEKEKRNTDREEKPRVGKRDQQHATVSKPKTEVQPSNRSSKEVQSEKPYTVSTNAKNKSDLLRNTRPMNLNANTKKMMFVNSVPKEIVSETRNLRHHVEIPKREIPRRKDEVMIKGNETQQRAKATFEDQISPFQKRKQFKLASNGGVNLSESSSKEAEVRVNSPKKSETRTKIVLDRVPIHKEVEKEAEVRVISPKISETITKIAIEHVPTHKEAEKEAEVHVISPKKSETIPKIAIDHVPTHKEIEAEAHIVSPKKSEASTEILIEDVTLEKELEVTIDSPKKSEARTTSLIEDLPSKKEAEARIIRPKKSEASTEILIEDVKSGKELEVTIDSPKKSEASMKLLIEDLPSKKEAEEGPTLNSSKGIALQIPIIGENLLNPSKSVVSSKKLEAGTELLIEDVSSEKEIEATIVGPKKSEASTRLLIEDLPSEREAEKDLIVNSSIGSELHTPIVGENLPNPSKNSQSQSQDMATQILINSSDNKEQLPSFDEDTCQKSQKFELQPENGSNEVRLDMSTPQEHEQKKKPISENNELLTESEIYLKRTLLRSRLFLNTAEALFDISIPADIRHVTDYIRQDDTGKIMLDIAYEIMRRKGKKRELSLYPLQKISNLPFKVTSFHDLVKQLNTDLEKLKIKNEGTKNEGQDTEESIQVMLKRDVQNRDTDVNPAWDLGWSEVVFAIIERNELIKDLERFLIDSVIDDIARELLHLHAYT